MSRAEWEQVERDKRLWVPEWLEGDPSGPAADASLAVPELRVQEVNWIAGEVERADLDTMLREIQRHGKLDREPEIGRAVGTSGAIEGSLPESSPPSDAAGPVGIRGYSDTYWTHFDWTAPVRNYVNRTQRKFPWLTYINTYYCHPPVFGRRYEFVSWDVWDGGLSNGRYVGYRGKPLPYELGTRVFNAIWNDPRPPMIYWIIYRGSMWVRGSGWEPAPWGPADSDPLHNQHIHITCVK